MGIRVEERCENHVAITKLKMKFSALFTCMQRTILCRCYGI